MPPPAAPSGSPADLPRGHPRAGVRAKPADQLSSTRPAAARGDTPTASEQDKFAYGLPTKHKYLAVIRIHIVAKERWGFERAGDFKFYNMMQRSRSWTVADPGFTEGGAKMEIGPEVAEALDVPYKMKLITLLKD